MVDSGASTMAKERKDVSVKIDGEAYRLAKTVASWKEMGVNEYLTAVVTAAAKKDLAKIQRDLSRQSQDEADTSEN
jgi:hypothetical protein